jgi:hypothetical protein
MNNDNLFVCFSDEAQTSPKGIRHFNFRNAGYRLIGMKGEEIVFLFSSEFFSPLDYDMTPK